MFGSATGRFVAAVGLSAAGACTRPSTPGGVDAVRPAVIEWQVGVNEKGGGSPMLETILPATFEGKPVWRIVHRDPDPTVEDGASFDMYDVDRATLAPVRSVMRREGFFLALSFEGDHVRIDRREADERRSSELRVHGAIPEGPGARVFFAALPLRVGYDAQFRMVDRWARDEVHRVADVRLTVPKRARIETSSGSREALEVLLEDRDGAFSIRSWLRPEVPHYPFKIEYRRGDTTLVSEVTRTTFLE